MNATLKKYIKKQIRNIKFYKARKELKNTDFTIISNNCWGAHISRNLNVGYNSPFIGVYMFAPDYLKLLKNLKYYMNQELKFSSVSKYQEVNDRVSQLYHPVGLLDDIEIQMLHYKTDKEAKDKWERRVKRINWNNLFIKISERYGCTLEILEEFEKLPFKNKVSFTEKEYANLKYNIYFKDFSFKSEMRKYTRYFDVVKWLNDGKTL